jgi:oligoribonuclease
MTVPHHAPTPRRHAPRRADPHPSRPAIPADASTAGTAVEGRGPLVWVDVEITGLDARRDLLLEKAVVITDADLNELAVYRRLAAQSADTVAQRLAVNPYATHLHNRSGLLTELAQTPDRAITLRQMDTELSAMLERHEAVGAPLAGFSVGFDRAFLQRGLPGFAARLGYRAVDVATLTELARRWWPLAALLARPAGKASHRALDDVRCAIVELRCYRERLEQGAAQ